MSNAKTSFQSDYVRGLQRKLRIPNPILDQHCQKTFGQSFDDLDGRQTSQLLNDMISWEAVPADLQRAMGQLDLFEGLTP